MGIPNFHQLKFNSIKDAKSLLQAVEKRFGRNAATKKTQRNLLKQYQLEIHGESISQEDVNQMFLRKVKETSSTSTDTKKVAFVSSNSTSSSNGAVNTAHGATTTNTQATIVNSTTINNLKEMDFRWQMVMLTIRARRFLKNTRRKLFVNGTETIRNKENTRRVVPVKTTTSNALVSCDGLSYDWSDQAEEGLTNFTLMAYSSTSSNSEVSIVSNCSSSCLENVKILKEQNEQLLKDLSISKLNTIAYKIGLESVEARLLVYKKNESIYEEDIKVLKCDIHLREVAITELRRKLDLAQKQKDEIQYNAVPPPYTGYFMPSKPDLSFTGLEEFASELVVIKPVVENSKVKAYVDKPKIVRKNNSALIIKDWVSDSEKENVPPDKNEKKTVKSSFAKIDVVKSKEQVKSPRKTTVKQGSNFEMINKACYVCGSFHHLQNDCDNQKRHPKRNMVPKAVLMKSGLVSLTTTRPVSTAQPKTTMNSRVNTVKDKNVNTARPKVVLNAVKGNQVNAVKASACWVWRPKQKILDHVSKHNSASMKFKRFDYIDAQGRSKSEKGVIDSGCSRHMTGNMSYLTDFEEIDGGYVAFGGNPKGGKITGRGTIKTGNLDFENVYFVRELKFNLFSVSQMCDKKNSVLFNDTECIVLSPNFKLTDESHVLLKVPRKNNMYSVDLKNIVPKGGLTCLFAKATSDESKLWHGRLGYVNFKTMNKLVKGNLVRGWPSKLFKMIKTVLLVKRESSTEPLTMLADSKLPITFWAEAVNTACYAQNRVLVVKPHNKTPYELFHGRTPTLSFMRPFGCPVTILNTIDNLGKFDGKVDEGFFVEYSLNSKAFRVLNSRTRIVEENLHIMFSENTPNVVGNQSNSNADPKSSHNDESKPSRDDEKKVDEDPRKDSANDPNMPELEEIVYSDDDEDVGAEADINNVNTFMTVSHIPTTRVYKDHPVEQIIGDLNSAPQTRRMTKNLEKYGFVGTTLKQRTNHKDLQNCLFSCFLSQEEPKKMDVKSAFLYGKIQEEVYVFQPPGFEDPDLSDRVYKVEKALYGLHQAPIAWYETLSTYLLDNGFQRGMIDKTLFIKMDKGDILLVQVYVDDIIFGSTKKSLCTEFEKYFELLVYIREASTMGFSEAIDPLHFLPLNQFSVWHSQQLSINLCVYECTKRD
ncbi:ribonuclease H-like domain-containing protein [Tanacetum coccineum]